MRFILGRVLGQTFSFVSTLTFAENTSKFSTRLHNAMIGDIYPYGHRDVEIEPTEEGQARFTITLKASYAEIGIRGWLIEGDQHKTIVKGSSFIDPRIALFYLPTIPIGIVLMVIAISAKDFLFFAGGLGCMMAGLGYYARFIKAPLNTLVTILEKELSAAPKNG